MCFANYFYSFYWNNEEKPLWCSYGMLCACKCGIVHVVLTDIPFTRNAC